MVGLDPESLFQPKLYYDSMILFQGHILGNLWI